MNEKNANRLTDLDQWFRYWMPYTYEKIEVPKFRHVYLPLNRNYKPLGILSGDWVDYEDYLHQAVRFSSDPHTFDGVWYSPETLHLYEDATKSRIDYFARLERLFTRSLKLYRHSD